jgi:hypothetical protein
LKDKSMSYSPKVTLPHHSIHLSCIWQYLYIMVNLMSPTRM